MQSASLVQPLHNVAGPPTNAQIPLEDEPHIVKPIVRTRPASELPRTAGKVSVHAIVGLPLFEAGDDIASEVAAALRLSETGLCAGDVVVLAQKVVSKVEGRRVLLAEIQPGDAALALADQCRRDPAVAELIIRESQDIMRATTGVIVTRHRTGHVLANAGIDMSNVSHNMGEAALLWPTDPDQSARRLRVSLEEMSGVPLAVIISDSLGRAWRMGTMGTAIGVSGMKPLRDRCGEPDLYGRKLQATITGIADEIAAAASLVIGEAAEGTPAAIVRGVVYEPDDDSDSRQILRPLDKDLFR